MPKIRKFWRPIETNNAQGTQKVMGVSIDNTVIARAQKFRNGWLKF